MAGRSRAAAHRGLSKKGKEEEEEGRQGAEGACYQLPGGAQTLVAPLPAGPAWGKHGAVGWVGHQVYAVKGVATPFSQHFCMGQNKTCSMHVERFCACRFVLNVRWKCCTCI